MEEITPILFNSGFRLRFFEGSKRPSFSNLAFNISKAFLSEPSPAGAILDTVKENLPHLVTLGVPRMITFIPSSIGVVSDHKVIKQGTLDSSSLTLKKTHLPWLTLNSLTSPVMVTKV